MLWHELLEGFHIAQQAIASNAMRSFLTTLGVVIGVTFVILTGWALNGLDSALEQTITLIGTDVLYVDKFDWSGGNRWADMRNRKNINTAQVDQLIERLTTAQTAVPSVQQWNNTIKRGNQYVEGVAVVGTLSGYTDIAVGNIAEGRFFVPVEDTYRSYSVVLGYNVVNALFSEGNAIGKTVKIRGTTFTVVGTLEKQGTLLLDFVDNQVYIPLNIFRSLYGADRSMTIAVKAGGEERLDEVRLETRGLMRQIRNIAPGRPDDFSINESKVFRESLANIRLSVWGVGIGMTILSFVVGIIGIMNIMFVSVTERTREIGIRKALGARRRSILYQFLVESTMLCCAGALAGFVLCSALILVITIGFESASFLSPFIPPNMLGIASVTALIVGILAGMLPALRASRMNPVDALRKE